MKVYLKKSNYYNNKNHTINCITNNVQDDGADYLELDTRRSESEEAVNEINNRINGCLHNYLLVDGGEPLYETGSYYVYDGDLRVVQKYVLSEADRNRFSVKAAKTRKLQELNIYLDSVVMLINGIPIWVKDDLIGSLKKTAENLENIGATEFPLILMEDMLFLPEGSQRKQILNTVFKIDVKEFKKHLMAMDLYAQKILLVEVGHKKNINTLESIEALQAYDCTAGFPPILDLQVSFL